MLTIEKIKEYITQVYGEHMIEEFGYAIRQNDFTILPTPFILSRSQWADSMLTLLPKECHNEYYGVVLASMRDFSNSVYIRVDGYYNSYSGYDGSDLTIWKEVEPVEKTIIEYEERKDNVDNK